MLYREPEIEGISDNEDAESVDSDEVVNHPNPSQDVEDAESVHSVGDLSVDDQDGSGEADQRIIPLSPSATTGSCCGCGCSVTVSTLGELEAHLIFEQLLLSERLNLLCNSCGEEVLRIGPRNG